MLLSSLGHRSTDVYVCIYYQPIGIMVRVSANSPGDLSSILDWVIPKT